MTVPTSAALKHFRRYEVCWTGCETHTPLLERTFDTPREAQRYIDHEVLAPRAWVIDRLHNEAMLFKDSQKGGKK